MCWSKPPQGLHGTSVIQSEARETHVRLTVGKLDCTESKRVVLRSSRLAKDSRSIFHSFPTSLRQFSATGSI